ncbi:MAG: peptide chain release factor 2 [Planctomycetota bacterium]
METSDTENRLKETERVLFRVKDAVRYDERRARLKVLEASMGAEGFWNDRENADKVIEELKRNKDAIEDLGRFTDELEDLKTLLELAKDANDVTTASEVERGSVKLERDVDQLELRTLLSGKYDRSNSYMRINAGAGGTESCDWAAMLRRMYLRWAERNNFKVTILDELAGEEAGYRNITMVLRGNYAYGYLKGENGVHRLVRISPFDAKSSRHTSFVSVSVWPEVDDLDEVVVNEADLRIDTYRSSGAGGQHVNTTDSAVRITHIPTNIVVQCQNERSQHSNKATAMRMLQSRLVQHEGQKLQDEISSLSGEKGKISFGSQIRSYVLAPYKMVKDHRAGVETGNVDQVLDGDLAFLIEANLRLAARSTNP